MDGGKRKMKYAGIDTHLKTCEATVMGGKVRITGHAKFATSELEIRRFFLKFQAPSNLLRRSSGYCRKIAAILL